ncbi:MAG: hypothetical protein AAFY37_08665 [Pseudomonadota bacterium]
MRTLAVGIAGLALSACGGGDETGAPAPVAEAPRAAATPCAKLTRIIDARDDQPAFSTLVDDDALDGAVACQVVSELIPAEHWVGQDDPAVINRRAYVCTFLETGDRRDTDQAVSYWETLFSTFGLGCLEDWTAGGGALLDPDAPLRFRSFTLTPPIAAETGQEPNAPLSINWLLSDDPALAPLGQRVTLYVLDRP